MLKKEDGAFYCDNRSAENLDYISVSFRTFEDLGLTPYFYGNMGLSIRHTNMHREMQEDLYKSKVLVILLGTGPDWDSENLGDNWALSELDNVLSKGIQCLIYIIKNETSDEEVQRLNLPIDVIKVENKEHFENSLRQEIQQRMDVN